MSILCCQKSLNNVQKNCGFSSGGAPLICEFEFSGEWLYVGRRDRNPDNGPAACSVEFDGYPDSVEFDG